MSADAVFEPFPEPAVHASVFSRFEQIVSRFADHQAVRDTSTSLTYEELAGHVARAAAATMEATADRPGPIAILLPETAAYPVAMLAALAAGRAYVPLDAGAPVERNRAIVSYAGACAILSDDELLAAARAIAIPETVAIDVWSARAAGTVVNPRPDPQEIACILYTSGSTGEPQGVVLAHSNILKSVQQYTDVARITSDDRLLAVRMLSTGSSVRVIYGALLNGASLHVLPPRTLGLAGLAAAIRDHRGTICHAPPTLVRRLYEQLAPAQRLDTVRVASLAGEPVEWSDVDLCRSVFSADVRVYTGLNSTESSGGYCQWFIDDAVRATCTRPPVGRPLPGWHVRLLDEDERPVPDGEVGEVVVVSRWIALGHWGGPHQGLVPFPSAPDETGCRVLRTGDLARRRDDGLIEFAGRKDHLVKLRGARANMLEIETALTRLCEVRDGAVIARTDDAGTVRALVACVVRRPEYRRVTGWQVQATLAQTLPRFMVPGQVVFFDELPRLANAKIDRVRLTAIVSAQGGGAGHGLDDPLVRDVARRFESVLNVLGASADDNVASLGGDSLQATSLVADIERSYGVAMPDDLAADDPTIERVAEWLRSTGLAAG